MSLSCCLAPQDEVTNFHPRGTDLDYPGKLQQRQEQSSTEQTSPTHHNGDAPAVAVPQQNTDSQVWPAAWGLKY